MFNTGDSVFSSPAIGSDGTVYVGSDGSVYALGMVSGWDINRDGMVDILDLVIIGKHYGESPPEDTRVDVNGDGKVDITDLVLVGKHLGEKAD
ncbi:hypothetical protein FJZ31_40170 [Candidatus Poribacteria bacterium]|nr:hypothetical protein [Candidatus Poribacteria bacterium]